MLNEKAFARRKAYFIQKKTGVFEFMFEYSVLVCLCIICVVLISNMLCYCF